MTSLINFAKGVGQYASATASYLYEGSKIQKGIHSSLELANTHKKITAVFIGLATYGAALYTGYASIPALETCKEVPREGFFKILNLVSSPETICEPTRLGQVVNAAKAHKVAIAVTTGALTLGTAAYAAASRFFGKK